MVAIPKKKVCTVVAVLCCEKMMCYIITVSLPIDSDQKWLTIRNFIRFINSDLYAEFKKLVQANRLNWFNGLAQRDVDSLYKGSAWGYISSEYQFNELVDDVLKSIPIKQNDSIFELGWGVGAVLQRVRRVYEPSISLGGDNLSITAIKRIRKAFPTDAKNFYFLSMTEKNEGVIDTCLDHVICFGALAMYLYALQEAFGIMKPPGNLCSTHFVEPLFI